MTHRSASAYNPAGGDRFGGATSTLPTIRSPHDVLALVADMLTFEQEHLRVLLLSAKNRVLLTHEQYIGTLNSCTIRVCELFREAIRANAASILLIHNHPSGDPCPSPEDVELTRGVEAAGLLLDLPLLDHIIVGREGHLSLRERGLGFSAARHGLAARVQDAGSAYLAPAPKEHAIRRQRWTKPCPEGCGHRCDRDAQRCRPCQRARTQGRSPRPASPGPCTCGSCRSCCLRQAWASGKFAARRHTPRWDTWTEPEDRRLAELAGRDLAEIAAVLSQEFHVRRTPASIRVQATRQHISLWRTDLSLRDVERLFGVDHRAVVRWWITPGLLPARRGRGRGASAGWYVEAHDLERFVRTCGWAFDWRRMDRRHPLARLAEVLHHADPWLSRAEAARCLGVCPETLSRWAQRGLVPHQRRPGAGGHGELVVRASDLPLAVAPSSRAA